MISGIVPFESIVESVKDETGIENARPYYEKIKRFIFRAEREIGYGGSVDLMKKTYTVSNSNNSSTDKYFKFPENFIEFEGVGADCKKINNINFTVTSEGVRFKEQQKKNIVLVYWGIKTNDEGYPLVTRNHEEAVIAYIVWKIYSQRIFLGIGNMNANVNYQQSFIQQLLEARGDDAFPTIEEWNAIGVLSYTDRRVLIDQPAHSYNFCEEEIESDEITNPEENQNKVIYYWQAEANETFQNIIDSLETEFFESKDQANLSDFANGKNVVYADLGRAVFLITNTEDLYYAFTNSLGSNINNAFNEYYSESLQAKLYVSLNMLVPSTVQFKINQQ
jgi:hypothetical protein